MNRYKLTNVLFSVTLLAAISTMARAQQCPNWSAEFDQIDDPVALGQLQSERSEGWPNLNPQTNGGISIQQGIQSLDQLIQQYQQELRQAQQAWLATTSSNAPMPKMNATECRNSSNMGAAMAAACEVDNMHNAILAAQGTIDLARCRAGMSPVSHSAFDSMGSGTSYPGGGLGSYAASFDSGAALEAGLNVSKRSGMVNSAVKSWHPPAEQQQTQDSLAQSAVLADPFAESISKDSAAAPSDSIASNDAPNSNNFTSSLNGANPSQGSSPSAPDSETDSHATSSTDVATATPSQAEAGAPSDSSLGTTIESSATPVAEILAPSNSSEAASSDANSTLASSVSRSVAAGDPSSVQSVASSSLVSDSSFQIDADSARPNFSDWLSAQNVSSNLASSSNPPTSQNLLEEGLSQTTPGQIIGDFRLMGSGDGQKQLDGIVDLADMENDEANSNSVSKYLVKRFLPLIHNTYSNAMNLLDSASQDLQCLVDPHCTSSVSAQGTEKQANQLFSNPFSSPPAN